MANRRISEFPEIGGAEIDESDLLNLVHVFEVDPILRNKKITFSGFKDYLSQYYSPISGGTNEGNLSILGNLTVSGSTNLTTLNCSSLSVFSSIIVQNNATVVNTFSGSTITGTVGNYTSTQAVTGVFTAELSGAAITGNTANFTTLTGATGNFTSELTAGTITGTTAKLTSITGISGVFTDQISGTTITGTTIQATNITGQTVVGTTAVSGTTVTGDTGNFTNVTGSTLAVTTPSGATPAIVCSGVVSGGTSGFFIQGPLVILA